MTWAQVELTRFHFYFTATLGQTFFYRHKLLTFSEREITTSWPDHRSCMPLVEDWKTKICTRDNIGDQAGLGPVIYC